MSCSLLGFCVADGFRLVDLEDSSQTRIDDCLYFQDAGLCINYYGANVFIVRQGESALTHGGLAIILNPS